MQTSQHSCDNLRFSICSDSKDQNTSKLQDSMHLSNFTYDKQQYHGLKHDKCDGQRMVFKIEDRPGSCDVDNITVGS